MPAKWRLIILETSGSRVLKRLPVGMVGGDGYTKGMVDELEGRLGGYEEWVDHDINLREMAPLGPTLGEMKGKDCAAYSEATGRVLDQFDRFIEKSGSLKKQLDADKKTLDEFSDLAMRFSLLAGDLALMTKELAVLPPFLDVPINFLYDAVGLEILSKHARDVADKVASARDALKRNIDGYALGRENVKGWKGEFDRCAQEPKLKDDECVVQAGATQNCYVLKNDAPKDSGLRILSVAPSSGGELWQITNYSEFIQVATVEALPEGPLTFECIIANGAGKKMSKLTVHVVGSYNAGESVDIDDIMSDAASDAIRGVRQSLREWEAGAAERDEQARRLEADAAAKGMAAAADVVRAQSEAARSAEHQQDRSNDPPTPRDPNDSAVQNGAPKYEGGGGGADWSCGVGNLRLPGRPDCIPRPAEENDVLHSETQSPAPQSGSAK
jgi:hypothetical protein